MRLTREEALALTQRWIANAKRELREKDMRIAELCHENALLSAKVDRLEWEARQA